MQTRGTLIDIKNLTFSYDGKVVLNDVNATVKDIVGRGQIVALLGPSGMGKTTLFRLLAGFEKPTSGVILVQHEGEFEPVHSHIMGVVTQKYPLFPQYTVMGNLLLANSDKDRCRELLAKFKMCEHSDKYPCQLSGGQRQRIAIIQQVLCSGKYILMDEPFSGLDLMSKCDVCKLIRDVAALDEENTIIVVTHGIEDALKVADTVWMMGRHKDKPGAYIKENISLIDRGLSMECCNASSHMYRSLIDEITQKFYSL